MLLPCFVKFRSAALGVAVASTITLAACSLGQSVPDQMTTICLHLRSQVDAVPAVSPDEFSSVTAPKLDREYAFARQTQDLLRKVAASDGHRYDDFIARWQALVVRLGQAAQLYHGRGLPPDESDTGFSLLIAAEDDDLNAARAAITRATTRTGPAACTKIPWRYFDSDR